jgi:hypothetical protein
MIALLLAWITPISHAYSPRVEQTVLVLLRALAYDRALARTEGDQVLFGVVFDPEDLASRQEADEIDGVLSGLVGTTLGGRAIGRPTLIPIGQTPLAGRSALTAYVLCRGLAAEHLAEVSARAREDDVATLALVPEYVGTGASLGAEQRGARLRVVVDLPSAREEGLDLSLELLELARVLGAP